MQKAEDDQQESGQQRFEELLSVEEVHIALGKAQARAVDVRDLEQWQASRIPGSIHYVADEIDSALEDWPDDIGVIVICADGKRSGEVASELRDRDVNAASLKGGIKAWESAGEPLQPSKDSQPIPNPDTDEELDPDGDASSADPEQAGI